MKTIANISAGELVNGWSCCQNQYMAKLIAQVPRCIRIFAIINKKYHPCRFSETLQGVISQMEWDTEKCRQREAGKIAQKKQITAEVKLTCELRGIITEANRRKEGLDHE